MHDSPTATRDDTYTVPAVIYLTTKYFKAPVGYSNLEPP